MPEGFLKPEGRPSRLAEVLAIGGDVAMVVGLSVVGFEVRGPLLWSGRA